MRMGLVVCVVSFLVCAVSGTARADELSAAFGTLCNSHMNQVAVDMKKTRELRARGKEPSASVKPADVVGIEYIDRMMGLVDSCPQKLQAFLASPVGQKYVPESMHRPGGAVYDADVETKAVRMVTTFLKTVPRVRLSAVDEQLQLLSSHAVKYLNAINRLQRATEANKARLGSSTPAPQNTTPSRHFDTLRECAARMIMLGNDMENYRRKTWSTKGPNERLAPATVVHPTNAADVMKWRATCEAETAKVPHQPMVAYVPADFLKPHIGGHARMKAQLAGLKLAGAFLQSKTAQRLAATDNVLAEYRKAANDFMRYVDQLYKHAEKQK